ncbi:hypothetical protein DL770_007073 [Monosporascus sp. CRB-9-2]|nr:hypothetical protein DL770_007073 [Monosporascus sp. CRB-9-2]
MPEQDEDVTGSLAYRSSARTAQLCSLCCNLDLETMLRTEGKEKTMGRLSDYADPECPFCSLISKAICLAWGSTATPPLKLFIQSRSPLSVKMYGRVKHPQPRLQLAVDQKPPSFQQNSVTVREIVRVKNRFIIAEIESVPEESMSSRANEEPFLSRRGVGGQINVPLLKHWLEDCQNHTHSKTVRSRKSPNLFQHEDGFRLIDVIDECLVQKSEWCDYVALSYVWGGVTPFHSTTKNVKRLSDPKGLSPPQVASVTSERIPSTVLDAMVLTRNIGMRYLWVDNLCIVQDDQREKSRLIGRMDEVYENATVTIIAAAGSDANAGLKGISPHPDPTPYRYMGDLSSGLDIKAYQSAVQDYSRKNLSFPEDVFNAFEGIFNRFNKYGGSSELSIKPTQGIPIHLLSLAILWFPSDGSRKRRSQVTESEAPSFHYSTWSWASWIGAVEFVFADSRWLSRNISQALIKKVPIYVTIASWYYGGFNRRCWSHNAWKAAGEAQNDVSGDVADDLSVTRAYLSELGINADELLRQSLLEAPESLIDGELGFFGAYLPAREVRLSTREGVRVGTLEISCHHGEFMFDGEMEEVDEFVLVVAGNTITKPPDKYTVFLGSLHRPRPMQLVYAFVALPAAGCIMLLSEARERDVSGNGVPENMAAAENSTAELVLITCASNVLASFHQPCFLYADAKLAMLLSVEGLT